MPDISLSASWSYNGSLFVVSCKDKKIRIIDPRSGTVVKVHYMSFALLIVIPLYKTAQRTHHLRQWD